MKTQEDLVEAAKDLIDIIAAQDNPVEALEELEEYLNDIAHVCRTLLEMQEEPGEYKA
jgi:hypothetical protein